MFNSNVFNYVNVLQKAADAAWLRNDVLSNNISNVSTPGYKRQDVDFESQLKRAMGNTRYKTVDERVSNIRTSELNPTVYTDSVGFSYRLDGNNVDVDQEQVEIVRTAYEYQHILNSFNNDITRLRSAAKTF